MGLKGIDPLTCPPDRFLNMIHAWLIDGMDDKDLAKFERDLWMPIKGRAIPEESPWSAENERKAFSQFSQAINS